MDIGEETGGLRALGEHVLQQIVAASGEGMLLLDARDADLAVVYANPAYASLSGYSADELVGAPWRPMQRAGGHDRELERVKLAIGCGEACRAVLADIRKDGTSWVSEVCLTPLYDTRGDLRLFLCSHSPPRQKRPAQPPHEANALQRELGSARVGLASLDRIDPATGLMRYEHFLSLLARDVAIARRAERPIAVLMFEIVEFDVYRRTFGSNAADSCLRMVGAQVAGAFRRAGDLCARCGESTLVAVAQGLDEPQARAVAARVADKVRGLGLHNPRASAGRYVVVQCAVMARVPPSDEPEAVLDAALARLRGGLAPAEPSCAVR